jgi:signal transduction histidine kinase
LGQIGQIHKALNNFDKAIEYLEQAKTIAEEVNFPNSIITVYYDLGSIYRMKGDRDKALEYALKALTISVEHRNKQYEIITPCLISSIYAELKNNDKAFEYAQQAVKTAEEYGEKRLIIAAMDALSRVYFNQKKYKECDDLARKAWEQDTLNDGPTGHNLIARLLFVNVQLGKTDDAMYFLEELQKILDHENDDNLHKNIAELEVKYETEKKELRIASLEKEKQLYIWLGIAGVTILLLVLGLSFFRHRMNVQKRKLAEQKIKQLEQEKQIIAAQSVLEGETEERKRVAEELHDGLGAMLSVVKLNLSDAEHIQNARDLLDRSINELRRIAHHMMPESLLRYGLKVSLEDFSLSVPNMKFHYFGDDSRLDNKMEALIYRCVHELVNNAIKYSGAENINVQLVRDDDRVSLTIQDDGCGFDSEIPTKGTGLKNLRNRVTTYNGTLNIYSSPGKGTEVYVDIPLKLK